MEELIYIRYKAGRMQATLIVNNAAHVRFINVKRSGLNTAKAKFRRRAEQNRLPISEACLATDQVFKGNYCSKFNRASNRIGRRAVMRDLTLPPIYLCLQIGDHK